MTTGGGAVGRVHSWDLSTGVDGPGTRYVVFTAGCPLRCAYCHNPDTWSARSGTPTAAADVVARAARYAPVLRAAGGGVTVSGGEPLLQPAFCQEVLEGCVDLGLHTALDTSGYLGYRASDALLDAVDLVLLDVKSFEPAVYRRLTRRDVVPTLSFARRLAERGRRTWVRFVVVPGWSDDPDNVTGLAAFLASLGPGAVERVDVLAYHSMGLAKYAALGIPAPTAGVRPPDAAALERVRAVLVDAGLPAVLPGDAAPALA